MTILRGGPDEWFFPKPGAGDRCILCHGPLYYPVLQWAPSYRGNDEREDGAVRFICKECCSDIRTGIPRDLREMATPRQLRRSGFHGTRPNRDSVFVLPEDSQH